MVINYYNLISQMKELSNSFNHIYSTVDWEKTLLKHKEIIEERIKKGIIPERFSAPLGVQIEVTQKCNLKCIHCYNNSGRDNISYSDDLSDSEWIEVAEQIADLDVFECIISGGEPLLRKDLVFKMMDIIAKKEVSFLFITNGLLCDSNVVERLKNYHYHYVQVSIDGATADVHDLIRGRKGSWEKAVNAASLIKTAHLPLCIASTLMKQNQHQTEELIDLAVAIGANQIIIDGYMTTGAAAAHTDQIKLDDGWRKEFNELILKKKEEHFGRIEILTSIEAPFQLRQYVIDINKVMLVRPNGDLKLDCITPFVFGNVRKHKLRDVWDKSMSSGWKKEEVVKFVERIVEDSSLKDNNEFPIPHLQPNVNLTHYLED